MLSKASDGIFFIKKALNSESSKKIFHKGQAEF
jgi:hypothetical protein